MRRLALISLTVTACGDAPVVLRVGRADTVVVNHQHAVPLPLTAVFQNGDTVGQPAARWRQVGGPSLNLTDSGTVTCTAAFDARVVAEYESRRAEALIRCRPIKGFLFFGNSVSMRLSDAPAVYPINAVDVDGNPVPLIAGEAVIEDTSIAELDSGRVIAKRYGSTSIRIRAGNCSTRVSVTIRDTVASLADIQPFVDYKHSMTLVSGEYWSSALPAGHLILRLDTDSLAHDRVALGVLRANCARIRESRQELSCMTGDTSIVVVRRRPSAGDGSDTAQVVITRANWGPTFKEPQMRRVSRPRREPRDTTCSEIFNWRGRAR